jgi:hypothetical protein
MIIDVKYLYEKLIFPLDVSRHYRTQSLAKWNLILLRRRGGAFFAALAPTSNSERETVIFVFYSLYFLN